MDFLGGALPNVMFIVGMLAIGLGLGIELKLVPLNKEIDKTGRIGAMIVGAILVAGSLYIYLNPALANRNQPNSTAANIVQAPLAASANNAQAVAVAPTAGSQAAPTAKPATSAPAAPPPAAPPTAAPAVTPTAKPAATQIAQVKVPDLHSMSEDEAQNALKQVGLQARKVDRCSGADQGDPKAKKHRIQCQNPAASTAAPVGTTVDYVVR